MGNASAGVPSDRSASNVGWVKALAWAAKGTGTSSRSGGVDLACTLTVGASASACEVLPLPGKGVTPTCASARGCLEKAKGCKSSMGPMKPT